MACNVDVERINFNNWFIEDWQPIVDCPSAEWELENAGFAAIQTQNGQPSVFCSTFNAFDFFGREGTTFTGQVEVDEPNPFPDECQALEAKEDDDFWGFALGYNPGDSTQRNSADFMLIDWKARDQDYSESCDAIEDGEEEGVIPDDCRPCVCDIDSIGPGWQEATNGLAVSRVRGLIHVDEFWSHEDCDCGNQFPGTIEELKRGRTLGDTAWRFKFDKPNERTYKFRFDFSPDVLRVYIDDWDTPQITLTANQAGGQFQDGRLCFYNYSQENVRYFAFNAEEFCPPDPDPTPRPTRRPTPFPPQPPTGGKGKGKGGTTTTKSTKSTKGTGGSGGKGKGGSKGDDDDYDDSSYGKGGSMSKGDDDDDDDSSYGKGGSMSKGDDDDDDDDSGGKGKGGKGKGGKKRWKKKRKRTNTHTHRTFSNNTKANVFGTTRN